MATALFRKVDCIRLPVPDLESGLAFYRDALGHALLWRTDTAAGLRTDDGNAEIVIHTEGQPFEVDLLVDRVEDAAHRVLAAGGSLVAGPFEITIGRCAVVRDPWGNTLTILDMSKGRLVTDHHGNVTGVDPAAR